MKVLIVLLCMFPFFALAQEETNTDSSKIVLTEEVNDCVNKIHENPAVIKLFLRNLAQDPERMRNTYKQLVNDPEVKRLIEEIRNNLRTEGMKEEKY